MINKTNLASCVLSHSGLGSLLRRTAGHRGFIVLNYHRIGDPTRTPFDRGVFSATAEMFARQLQLLRKDCDVIVPSDIPELPRRGRGRYAMITFDDGYRDNYLLAFPALRSAGLRAAFFLTTGFLDTPRLSWWDEIAWMVNRSFKDWIGPTSTLPACVAFGPIHERQDAIDALLGIYKKLPSHLTEQFLNEIAEASGSGRAPAAEAQTMWMSWEMVREMRDAGMVIGGHTVHHPILATLPRREQEAQILGCARAIEARLNQPMHYFAYPRGKPDAFNAHTREVLTQSQVRYAFTFYGGMNHPEALDPLDVRRVSVSSQTLFEHFEAMVSLPWIFA